MILYYYYLQPINCCTGKIYRHRNTKHKSLKYRQTHDESLARVSILLLFELNYETRFVFLYISFVMAGREGEVKFSSYLYSAEKTNLKQTSKISHCIK